MMEPPVTPLTREPATAPWIVPVTLTGSHVRLEPLSHAHAEGLQRAGADERIWEHLAFQPLATMEIAAHFIGAALAQSARDGSVPFAIISTTDGSVAGSTRYLNVRAESRGVEIGWTWLSPTHWRTVVNSECKLLLLQHAFEDRGAIRVELATDIRNHRSQKAIERLGAVCEGVLRNHRIRKDGTLRHSVIFSITIDEWPDVRQQLHRALATT